MTHWHFSAIPEYLLTALHARVGFFPSQRPSDCVARSCGMRSASPSFYGQEKEGAKEACKESEEKECTKECEKSRPKAEASGEIFQECEDVRVVREADRKAVGKSGEEGRRSRKGSGEKTFEEAGVHGRCRPFYSPAGYFYDRTVRREASRATARLSCIH